MNEARPVVVMLLPASDYDPTESAVIWDRLTASGVEVRFATPGGEPAYADPRLVDKGFSVLSPVLMTRQESLKAYKRMVDDAHFGKPTTYDEVDVDKADGVFVPGGHAAGVRTLIESSAAQAIAATAMSRDIPLGAVCHGVLLLARSIDPSTGRSPLYGRRTTALTAALELGAWTVTRLWLGDYYRTYPTTVQAEVTSALASPSDFHAGPRMTLRDSPNQLDRGFTVKDGNYVSGRWPGDCHRLAADYVDMVLANFRSGG